VFVLGHLNFQNGQGRFVALGEAFHVVFLERLRKLAGEFLAGDELGARDEAGAIQCDVTRH